MMEIHPLTEQLKLGLGWHQARIKFLAHFLLAVIKVRTVNLAEIANAFDGKAKVDSNDKRLQRFMRYYPVDYGQVARWVVTWLRVEEPWILCLDRTNWEFGKVSINILVLAVAHQGAAIPLFWTLLGKKGNSDTEKRINLLQRFLAVFPKERIGCLTADREFRGKRWLEFLIDEKIPFRIRIPNNTKVPNKWGTAFFPVRRLFAIRVHEVMVVNKPRAVWGIPVFLVATRTSQEHVIIMTNHAPQRALADYRRRWEIETLFGCLKSRGFNLEDTHLKDMERLSRLLALISLAFCWAYRIGIWQHKTKPIRIKNHLRMAQSIFRRGLDFLRHLFLNRWSDQVQFQEVARVLSCT